MARELFGSMTYGEEYHGNWYRSPSDGPRCVSRRGAAFFIGKVLLRMSDPLLAQSRHRLTCLLLTQSGHQGDGSAAPWSASAENLDDEDPSGSLSSIQMRSFLPLLVSLDATPFRP